MPDWLERTLLTVAFAIVVLLLMWPTRRSGQRLLRTWGMPDSDEAQAGEAVRYLWQRRILYVVLFVGLPALANLLGLADARLPWLGIFGPLLMAMLIAELIAVLRPVGGVRSASLNPRGWRDLVPNWALVVAAVLIALVVAFAVAVPAPMADRLGGIGYAAAGLLLVGLLVQLAVLRPAVDDEAVAAALRLRSARVAVGIGFAWLGSALTFITRTETMSWGSNALLLQLFAVFAWIWIANGTQNVFARNRR